MAANRAEIALFDVDGTLVDTNYQHALAWYRAFRRVDLTLPLWQIHRHIGMGGDQIVTAMAGDQVEKEHGDELREAWTEEFAPMLAEIEPFEGLLVDQVARVGGCLREVLAERGHTRDIEAIEPVEGRPRHDVEVDHALLAMKDDDSADERDRHLGLCALHVLKQGAQPLGLVVGRKERVGSLAAVVEAPGLLGTP